MTVIGDAYIEVKADTKGFADDLNTHVGSAAKTAVAVLTAAFAAVKVKDFLSDAIAEGREALEVQRQTEAVLKSTGGAANVTTGHIGDLANKLSVLAGVDDELVQHSENVLLTFTKVRNEAGKGNDIFDQATEAALNMSAALGTDLQGATLQLGKALNDPVKGITALTRAGVSFTTQQKDQIKAMVAAGNTLGAQKLILKEFNTEFGGAAAAAADPMKKLQVVVKNLEEAVGVALLPVINKGADLLGKYLPAALDLAATAFGRVEDATEPVREAVTAVVKTLVDAFSGSIGGNGITSDGWVGQVEKIGVTLLGVKDDVVEFAKVLANAFSADDTFGLTGDDGVAGKAALVGKALRDLVTIGKEVGTDLIKALTPVAGFAKDTLAKALGPVVEVAGALIGYLSSADGATARRVLEGIVVALLAAKAAEEVAGKVNTFVTSVGKLQSAAQTAFPEVRSLAENIAKVGSKTASVAVDIGKAGQSALETVYLQYLALKDKTVEVTLDVKNKAKDALGDTKDAGKSAASNFASGFAGAIGGLIAGVVAPAIAAALGAAGVSVGAVLVGVAIAAAVLASGALVFVFRQQIGEFFTGTLPRFLTQTVPTAFATAFGLIPGILADALTLAGTALLDTLPDLIGNIGGVLAAGIVLAILGIPALIVAGIVNFGPTVVGAAANLAGLIAGAIASGVASVPGVVAGVFTTAVGAIQTAAGAAAGAAATMVSGIAGFLATLPGIVTDFVGRLPGLIGGFLTTAATDGPRLARMFVSGVLGEVTQLPGQITGVVSRIPGIVGDAFGKLPGIASGALDAVAGLIPGWATNILDGIGRFLGSLVDGFRDGWKRVNELTGGALGDLVGSIRGMAGNVLAAAVGVGAAIIDGIGQGLSSSATFLGNLTSAIADAMKRVINSFIDRLNDAIPDSLGWGFATIHLPANPIPELRAAGGPVTAGQPYIVGEVGPELFVPSMSGQIVANDRLFGFGGTALLTAVRTVAAGVYEVVRQMFGGIDVTAQTTAVDVAAAMADLSKSVTAGADTLKTGSASVDAFTGHIAAVMNDLAKNVAAGADTITTAGAQVGTFASRVADSVSKTATSLDSLGSTLDRLTDTITAAAARATATAGQAADNATNRGGGGSSGGGLFGQIAVSPDTLIQLPSGEWITAGAGAFSGGLQVAPGGQVYINPDTHYIPGRAAGGPTVGGRWYVVGENGPELFRAGSNGHITDAARTATMLGGSGRPIQFGEGAVQVGVMDTSLVLAQLNVRAAIGTALADAARLAPAVNS